ncbi:MAG: hypothetical protein HOP19_13340 [Acidobacteria bacterium]|nr:hypothetical protein [Acidobacteriota bacterium]
MNKKKKANTAPLNAPNEHAVKAARRPAKPAVVRNQRCCVHEYWAVVETNGTLVRGRNVVSVQRLSQGQYEVIFSDDVSQGIYVATIGRPGISVEPSGQIGVALRFGSANKGVWVDTHDSAGNPSDRAFHLVVHTD